MTYLSARSKRNTKHIRIAVLVIFVLIISFFWKPIQRVMYPAVLPIINTYVSIRDTGSGFPHTLITFFTSRSEYETKIQSLETKIEYLENEVAIRNTSDENTISSITSTSTTFTPSTRKSLTLFPVVKDMSTLYNSIVLSRGFVDDLEEGSIVYVRGYQAVGYITTIYKTTSVMKLYSSSGEKVEGVVKDIDASVTLTGQGGGSYLIEVPKTINVQEGQIVYLAAQQDMPLGTIVSVLNDPQDTFTRAYVRGAYNPNKAHIFYVNK